MQRKNPFILFFVLLLFSFNTSCDAQVATHSLEIAPGKYILILDSTDAAKTLVVDPYDLYFERVRPVEMSIQMKQSLDKLGKKIRPDFMQFLQEDMASFSKSEADFVEDIMLEIGETSTAVSKSILPDTMYLLKTKARHFGEGVYYTRSNCIVIPYDALESRSKPAFKSTMFHELFHVYSRLNPGKRTELYQLIGFTSLGYDQLELPKKLSERVLHNPDGADFAQKISLKLEDGSTIQAVPIIYANEAGYNQAKKAFFAYLEFNLFEIKEGKKGKWTVQVARDGYSSTLNLRELPDFFRQIRNNTGYIIHPDEILADNFTFVMQKQTNPDRYLKFDEAGVELLNSVEKALREE